MNNLEIEFLKSATTIDSSIFPNSKIPNWIQDRRDAVRVLVKEMPLENMRQWKIDESTRNLKHDSGGFFTIEGIKIRTNWGQVSNWTQPIINQPEIGFLGFIAKKFDGILHFLVQAKIEPGNINTVQISPTLQATRSNYSQLHKGKRPRYLEYFNGEVSVNLLLDQLQSEQGARFLRKRNRNIIVEIEPEREIESNEDFIWLTIGQIKQLMRHDNIVNMDTRTVLSGISYGSYSADTLEGLFVLVPGPRRTRLMLESALNRECAFNNFRNIVSWITRIKSTYDLFVERIPIRQVEQWFERNGTICRDDGKYFTVIGVNVSIENREIVSWDQPMIKPAQEGLLAFIVRPINGVYHFLVQAKLEAGNFDIIELAPTVQCLTGNYRTGKNEYSVPYIKEVLSAPQDSILMDAMQSEEGGRFFKEQNRNMIVEVDESFPLEVSENYCWMTLNQMLRLIEFNNYLNISARSLISAISFA
ncbi:NDP-hexose 2,3-dehydratase family protein [Pandoraea sp.]|uniref:NDP-hexose 2,3-dehydratase family protein n=1 Tax=Pandoraea sp. TaxID=1883445 RepID=UPI0035AF7AAE